jgi:predicted esterase
MDNNAKALWISILLSVLFLSKVGLGQNEAYRKVVDDPGLPRVLLIGDSISIDYTPDTREMLRGKANMHRPPCNCRDSGNVAANIKRWLEEGRWDVVHFNAGIWDSHFVDENDNILRSIADDYYEEDKLRTSLEKYRENIDTIVDAILATGAKPIFATTTTIPRWNNKRRAYLESLNEIAKDLMYYKQIQINDLYGYSLPYLKEWQLPDQVHFNPLGKRELAKKVTAEILKALGSETKMLDWIPEETSQTLIYGREVIRYDHDCLYRWGYEESEKEYFYVVPAKKTLVQSPLVVFLHSAGGNAEKELVANVERLANYGDEFVGLVPNCPSQLARPVDGATDYDWWWGAKAIEKHPNRYNDKMTRIENRVLDTIEWVIQNYSIDRNRVYLRGISMGGSGTLGLGLAHGDVFAAIQAINFAGVDHAIFRLEGADCEPPYTVMLLSPLDKWSKGAEQLFDKISTDYLGMSYAWDIYGHDHKAIIENANPSVVCFPWLSIRRNQAYPVFTNASSDDKYPGHMRKEPDQKGQVNAYFRWSVLEDTVDKFIIELRMVNRLQFVKGSLSMEELEQMRRPVTADVTLRRLQNFKVSVETDRSYHWTIEKDGCIKADGKVKSNPKGLLTIRNIEMGIVPIRLIIENTQYH